jgi:quercetin dioxygenase-like cupin family protein/uncharacterized membrane protein YphA (DoxX/SURF4 family)
MNRIETFIERQTMSQRWGGVSSVVLRFGLGVGFLSAVADRLGLWGTFGQPNVEWGNFSRFLEYTQLLNWFVPAELIPPLGVIATSAEILLGLLLLAGWHTRVAALLSGFLLITFGAAMTLALGVKAPLNFAVLTGVGGALLLANRKNFPFSVDELQSASKCLGRKEAPIMKTVMTDAKPILMLVFLLTSILTITSTLVAQEASQPQETITQLTSTDLAECSGKEALMYTVDFPPGFSSPVHRHNAHVSVYVLEGSVVMQVKGGKEVTLTPGQTFYEGPNDVHVVSRNASRTKPAKFLVSMVKDKGAPLVILEK